MNVNKVAKLLGISIRTLHYYDEIGLLKSDNVTESGHRLYSDKNIITLKEILLFKELGIDLKSIKKILESPDYDSKQVMEAQKQLLIFLFCFKKKINDKSCEYKNFYSNN
ncbi:MerR family transcriptional regulator [Clostridium sp.]|uniref:MerR family transcriptional regulator n=1 Tax=Clostridium sp. TaxID=1506 RepID=UPI0034639DF2